MPAKKQLTRTYEGLTMIFVCEECEGQYLDTKVLLNDQYLCWCTFSEADKFADELFAIIDNYRI